MDGRLLAGWEAIRDWQRGRDGEVMEVLLRSLWPVEVIALARRGFNDLMTLMAWLHSLTKGTTGVRSEVLTYYGICY